MSAVLPLIQLYAVTLILINKENGGERGIRTPEERKPQHAFQACALSHSAISPHQGALF